MKDRLKVGRIDYLNIWPLFESITKEPVCQDMDFVSGHPSLLNSGLAAGKIDVSPSSSLEYLVRAEQYRLLPDLGISSENEIMSVLFCLPFSFDDLEMYVLNGGKIRLTSASAASVGLLKVLWHFYWKLPEPEWLISEPGYSAGTQEPFLEIGDHALKIFLNPAPGLKVIDLAVEWKSFTGLPFVFALWIANAGSLDLHEESIRNLTSTLKQAKIRIVHDFDGLAHSYRGSESISPETIKNYWEKIDYSLNPEHLAGLSVFGNYLTRLEIIPGMPVLDFI